jgi:hypothetical protein
VYTLGGCVRVQFFNPARRRDEGTRRADHPSNI